MNAATVSDLRFDPATGDLLFNVHCPELGELRLQVAGLQGRVDDLEQRLIRIRGLAGRLSRRAESPDPVESDHLRSYAEELLGLADGKGL